VVDGRPRDVLRDDGTDTYDLALIAIDVEAASADLIIRRRRPAAR
jgi:hypothetical protein